MVNDGDRGEGGAVQASSTPTLVLVENVIGNKYRRVGKTSDICNVFCL